MMVYKVIRFLLLAMVMSYSFALIPLPSFAKMKDNYPGYKHHGGLYHNNKLINMIGCNRDFLLHDTSALRLSYSFNKVGREHSLGKDVIHLSRNGIDSVSGSDGHQYIYHPIAYGPFLADKYGYPSVSKLHQFDPISTKKNFWGKQGILRVITYRKIKNLPVGHVALWDCDHFHETKDWISGHSLITAEFWESPDSNCTRRLRPTAAFRSQNLAAKNHIKESKKTQSINIYSSHSLNMDQPVQSTNVIPNHISPTISQQIYQGNHNSSLKKLLKNKTFHKKLIKKYYLSNGHLRHAKHRGLTVSNVLQHNKEKM